MIFKPWLKGHFYHERQELLILALQMTESF